MVLYVRESILMYPFLFMNLSKEMNLRFNVISMRYSNCQPIPSLKLMKPSIKASIMFSIIPPAEII